MSALGQPFRAGGGETQWGNMNPRGALNGEAEVNARIYQAKKYYGGGGDSDAASKGYGSKAVYATDAEPGAMVTSDAHSKQAIEALGSENASLKKAVRFMAGANHDNAPYVAARAVADDRPGIVKRALGATKEYAAGGGVGGALGRGMQRFSDEHAPQAVGAVRDYAAGGGVGGALGRGIQSTSDEYAPKAFHAVADRIPAAAQAVGGAVQNAGQSIATLGAPPPVQANVTSDANSKREIASLKSKLSDRNATANGGGSAQAVNDEREADGFQPMGFLEKLSRTNQSSKTRHPGMAPPPFERAAPTPAALPQWSGQYGQSSRPSTLGQPAAPASVPFTPDAAHMSNPIGASGPADTFTPPAESPPVSYDDSHMSNPMTVGKALSDKTTKEGSALGRTAPAEFLDSIEPYKFRYKQGVEGEDPNHEYYGVMAQNVAKTPMGRSIVEKTPEGLKLDTIHGFGTTLAAMSNLNSRVRELEGGKKGKR